MSMMAYVYMKRTNLNIHVIAKKIKTSTSETMLS
jgi:hypothetical protein